VKNFIERAVEQFRLVEQAQLLHDRRKAALERMVLSLAIEGSPEDEAEYFRLTEKVTKDYEEKRKKYGL
jgi:hypothetical protein